MSQLAVLEGQPSLVSQLQTNGKVLFSGSAVGELFMWDWNSHRYLRAILAHGNNAMIEIGIIDSGIINIGVDRRG